MINRVTKLKSILVKNGLDSILISNPLSVRYLSGLKCESAFLLITKEDNFIITDFRFREEAQEISDFQLKLIGTNLKDLLVKESKELGLRRLGFEAGALSYLKADLLKKELGPRRINFEPTDGIVENLRLFKDLHEIKDIKKCVSIAKGVLFGIRKRIRPGLSEKGLAQEIDDLIIRLGGHKNAFETIVASGKNSSRPHAAVTNKVIKNNETVMIDFGVNFNGYNCDLTRVYFLGKIHGILKDINNICREAQERAIRKIKPGVSIKRVDEAARGYIDRKGYGRLFGHALGHGIGLAVHESPSISAYNNQILKPGMVFTVEPGIYIESLGGVRIEDVVLVTQKGCEVLTK